MPHNSHLRTKKHPSTQQPSRGASSAIRPTNNERSSIPTEAGMNLRGRGFDDTTLASATPTITNHFESGVENKIDVFVRCRGRNDQEVQDKTDVVLNTNGVRGNTLELAMSSKALSNKTYNFDRVYSPTADQQMVFDDIVTPVLDEVLKGFNCTIFAYGQTGTGKTYTMTGDISDRPILSDDAGIIPRALHSLFAKLGAPSDFLTGDVTPETCVKVSYIELYNEELRDLLSTEERSNIKIFDGDNRRGAGSIVHGMEEHHITSAKKGVQLLRTGSHKRQVAATKCNDLSSRSHTVFTITVYVKQTVASGGEFFSHAKLNLVDLAGSENIGRSGAENKRASEAGLINKSLLALGRVINALVERSAHIPYRESKLTRLLQDSLGGRTKTCIIATLSPARSNLEESVSTLDYAFRAKNIRNKPQLNKLVPKKMLLSELTLEMEKLQSELRATRQRNGIYLTQEAYKELTDESRSHTILIKEQREKIETIECKLDRKGEELLELTQRFEKLRQDSEAAKSVLDNTKSLLHQTETAMADTRRLLDEESLVRQQHERTAQHLTSVNDDLVAKLEQTAADKTSLEMKLERLSELQAQSRKEHGAVQRNVEKITTVVDSRLAEFQIEQQGIVNALTERIHAFIQVEMDELHATRAKVEKDQALFEQSHNEIATQTTHNKSGLDQAVAGVRTRSAELMRKVGAGSQNLDVAARRISKELTTEIGSFDKQLRSSYFSLGMDFRATFDEALEEIEKQREEMNRLREAMSEANHQLEGNQSRSFDELMVLLDNERAARTQENEDMIQNFQKALETNLQQQQLRIDAIAHVSTDLKSAGHNHSSAGTSFWYGSKQLTDRSRTLSDRLEKAHNRITEQIQTDGVVSNRPQGTDCVVKLTYKTAVKHIEDIKAVTISVHQETAATVKNQIQQLETDAYALSTAVDCLQQETDTLQATWESSLGALVSLVQASHTDVGVAASGTADRSEDLKSYVREQADEVRGNLQLLNKDSHIRHQLADLRQGSKRHKLPENIPAGRMPTCEAYRYSLAASQAVDERVCTGSARQRAGSLPERLSPNKMSIFVDNSIARDDSNTVGSCTATSLSALDPNLMDNKKTRNQGTNMKGTVFASLAPLKRQAATSASAESTVPAKKQNRTSSNNQVMTSNAMRVERRGSTVRSRKTGRGESHSRNGG